MSSAISRTPSASVRSPVQRAGGASDVVDVLQASAAASLRERHALCSELGRARWTIAGLEGENAVLQNHIADLVARVDASALDLERVCMSLEDRCGAARRLGVACQSAAVSSLSCDIALAPPCLLYAVLLLAMLMPCVSSRNACGVVVPQGVAAAGAAVSAGRGGAAEARRTPLRQQRVSRLH